MKLATSNGDYGLYTSSQEFALEHIRNAGFKYADYSFGMDFLCRNCIYSESFEKYAEQTFIKNKEFFMPLLERAEKIRRKFQKDTRLLSAPIELKDAFEKYLFALGKCVLQQYNCFED